MANHFNGGNLKTAAKLVILDEYLDVYTTIMNKNWSGEKWYIDTHAGTGRTNLTDYGVIDGSAIIALDSYVNSFDKFYLYELNEDHFHTLYETLSDRFGYDFDVGPARVPDEDFLVARCDDPYIRIMQMDSNRGVSFLADEANETHHWFVFVDPKGLTAKRSTLDALIGRSNMDLLITYQTTGVLRSAAEGAEHAHNAVERTMGDAEWPNAGNRDDYVDVYKEKLEENPSIAPVQTKELISPHDARVRFDLIFACTKPKVRRIMKDEIMEQENLWEKASERAGQSGLSGFV